MPFLSTLIPPFLVVANIILAYRLMKLKGYTGWSYLYIVFVFIPIFWIVAGSYDSKMPTDKTKIWSIVAVVYGILALVWYIYFRYGMTNNIG